MSSNADKLITLPRRDPRDEEWLGRQTPLDHEDRLLRRCASCDRETVQDSWVSIVGAHVGFSLPFGRKSTVGKAGSKARWFSCAECGSLMPADERATAWLRDKVGVDFLESR
jgi:hypothetical protein